MQRTQCPPPPPPSRGAQLPIGTLLAYWDALLFRPPPRAPGSRDAALGSSPAHLQLALALLRGSAAGLRAILDDRETPGEAMGLGFERLLTDALGRTDAAALLTAASAYPLSPAQLAFLRRALRHETAGHVAPPLSGVAAARLPFLSDGSGGHTGALLALRVLRESLLLAPPPPPCPLARVAALSWPPQHSRALAASCVLTCAAVCLWLARCVASPLVACRGKI